MTYRSGTARGRWSTPGSAATFHPGLQQIQAQADGAGDIDWLLQIDSTVVRAHQHAADTGRKRGKPWRDEPDRHSAMVAGQPDVA